MLMDGNSCVREKSTHAQSRSRRLAMLFSLTIDFTAVRRFQFLCTLCTWLGRGRGAIGGWESTKRTKGPSLPLTVKSGERHSGDVLGRAEAVAQPDAGRRDGVRRLRLPPIVQHRDLRIGREVA